MNKKKPIGKVRHFFDKISVAVVELFSSLKVGDAIKVKIRDGEFEQTVDSLQVEHEAVQTAKKGDKVGMKVTQAVKEGDEVYLA